MGSLSPHSPTHSDRCSLVQILATPPKMSPSTSWKEKKKALEDKGLPKSGVFLSSTALGIEKKLWGAFLGKTLGNLSEGLCFSLSPSFPAFYSAVLQRNKVSPSLWIPEIQFHHPTPVFHTDSHTEIRVFSCSSVLRSAQKQQPLKFFRFQTLLLLLQFQRRNQCGAWGSCNKSWLLIMYCEIHKCWCFRDYWHNLAIPKLDKKFLEMREKSLGSHI